MKPLLALLLLTLQVTGFVRDGSVEIVFPQAVRFIVNLNIPVAQIASAQLIITPAGHDPIILDADPRQAEDDDQGSHMVYTWRISADDPPPLFGDIAYHWSITAAGGSAGTLDDSFTFADPRVDWTQIDPQTRFSVSLPRTLQPLGDSLGQVHALLEQNTGRRLDDRLLIYPMQPGCTATDDFQPADCYRRKRRSG